MFFLLDRQYIVKRQVTQEIQVAMATIKYPAVSEIFEGVININQENDEVFRRNTRGNPLPIDYPSYPSLKYNTNFRPSPNVMGSVPQTYPKLSDYLPQVSEKTLNF